MTDREKAIVMAHTGICMLAGEKFGVFHAYIEDIMGRPVYTHELAIQSISDEIKEKSRDDFKKLCIEEQETCDDAINREDTLKTMIEQLGIRNEDYLIPAEATLYKVVKNMPPVTPQPKMGHWGKDGECPFCGYLRQWDDDNFCGHCGAKMQELEDE